MNYQKIYDSICTKANNQVLLRLKNKKNKIQYYEIHHIIPRCMGGEGKRGEIGKHPNLVILTAKEHYICHRLLCKIYPDNGKLKHAIWCMVSIGKDNRYKVSSRIYEKLRTEWVKFQRNKYVSDESRKRISDAMKKRPKGYRIYKPASDELRKKLSLAHMGKRRSLESIEKGRQTRLLKGHRHSPESITKMKLARKQWWERSRNTVN